MASLIYYFSGTGNSLHVARELKRRLPETYLLPILSVLKKGKINPEADKVGFVFPVYLTSIPGPVRAFIENIEVQPGQYLFAVTTNCGYPGKVDYLLYSLLKSKGFKLSYYSSLKMLINTPTGLMPAFLTNKNWAEEANEKKASGILPELHKQLDLIAGDLANKVNNIKPDYHPNLPGRALLAITEHFSPRNKTKSIAFFVDHDCNGCGTCERVCLSGKVVLSDDNPEWLKDTQCYFCYACFNFCPQQAILVKGYSFKTGRYNHPGISADDIAGQKNMNAL